MSRTYMNINERILAFRAFAKDSTKTSSVLGDSSLDSYVTSLTKYEMACVVRLLCGASSIFEVKSPDAIQRVLNFFRSQKDAFANDAKLTAHYRDMASYVLKYLEFVCYESGVSMPLEDTGTYNAFSIAKIISSIQQTGLLYDSAIIKRFAFSLLAKPFVILSGLSGSGKTQLALAFAHSICENPDKQICIVPVGADWTNREPLLGYVNALSKDDYVLPESGVLQLILKAISDQKNPYFLILDEMNMSYVERYFADFLSSMESGKAIRLWNKNVFGIPEEIMLPRNLFIVGTINVDETTYMFSPKVLDRSSVIEFRVIHSEMENYLETPATGKINLGKASDASAGQEFVKIAGSNYTNNGEAKDVLLSFFDELKKIGAEFGYRSAKEINRFVSIASEYDDTLQPLSSEHIQDAAIMQKLLPKMHGSLKTLKPVLSAMWQFCFVENTEELQSVVNLSFAQQEEIVGKSIYPLTADKVLRMYRNAMANGFASYSEA